jgi:hypothetical protein
MCIKKVWRFFYLGVPAAFYCYALHILAQAAVGLYAVALVRLFLVVPFGAPKATLLLSLTHGQQYFTYNSGA